MPTAGHTLGYQAVIVDMGDHYILIGGDASYSEKDMLAGNIDGVCMDGKLHQQNTAKMRELYKRKPTIVQLVHDEYSEYRLINYQITKI